ncbi:MAG: hypothetical protein WKF58_13840 [Ilumatobacteraceae bacterium]
MGHANTNTTMGYIGWSPAEGAEVVGKITAGPADDELAAATATADRGVGGSYRFDLTTTVRRSAPRRASTALLRGDPLPVARRQHLCEMLVTDDFVRDRPSPARLPARRIP